MTKKRNLINFGVTAALFFIFVLYTVVIMNIDVDSIGPNDSSVGFATINEKVHSFFGVHMLIYEVTDILSIIAILIMAGFAVMGLVQLIRRKSIFKVDYNILLLGGFYVLVFAVYLFFEFTVINYRPILIENVLEASYPSSTTTLVICIIPTAMMEFKKLISNKTVRNIINFCLGVFAIGMVIGRMISGVHWFTDIIGGVLISSALIMFYYSFDKFIESKKLQ